LYVWTDSAGVIRTGFAPPKRRREFVSVAGDGFELLQDVAIETPRTWTISRPRFPWPHVRVLWNGFEPPVGGS